MQPASCASVLHSNGLQSVDYGMDSSKLALANLTNPKARSSSFCIFMCQDDTSIQLVAQAKTLEDILVFISLHHHTPTIHSQPLTEFWGFHA